MPPKVAAVTMTYNEGAYLPIWARHYARQVGADHCYVVDHGSTEPLVLPQGVNVLRLPRSPHDDDKRAVFIASLVDALLRYYDWVIHTDVDELVVADPQLHAGLPDFCRDIAVDTVTAIGLDVQQIPDEEPALNPGQSVGSQRRWARFTSAMCKPVLTRRSLRWSPGFHCADAPMHFSSLFLFHLRWADLDIGLERLTKTRTMPWGDGASGAHQRIADFEWTDMFAGMAMFARLDPVSFDPGQRPFDEWLEQTRRSTVGREHDTFTLDLHVNAAELWAIPSRFRAKL